MGDTIKLINGWWKRKQGERRRVYCVEGERGWG